MLDLTRPVQLRHGSKARILCTDCKRKCGPLVVLIESGTTEYAEYYSLDGCVRYDKLQSPNDLVNIPEKRKLTVWVNVYPKETILADTVYSNEYVAGANCNQTRVKCIPIEIEYEV